MSRIAKWAVFLLAVVLPQPSFAQDYQIIRDAYVSGNGEWVAGKNICAVCDLQNRANFGYTALVASCPIAIGLGGVFNHANKRILPSVSGVRTGAVN
jgi:hypothetical protein